MPIRTYESWTVLKMRRPGSSDLGQIEKRGRAARMNAWKLGEEVTERDTHLKMHGDLAFGYVQCRVTRRGAIRAS